MTRFGDNDDLIVLVSAECGDYVGEDYPDHTYLSSYKEGGPAQYPYTNNNGCLTPGVVDPNTLELDPVPRNWPNLDPDP